MGEGGGPVTRCPPKALKPSPPQAPGQPAASPLASSGSGPAAQLGVPAHHRPPAWPSWTRSPPRWWPGTRSLHRRRERPRPGTESLRPAPPGPAGHAGALRMGPSSTRPVAWVSLARRTKSSARTPCPRPSRPTLSCGHVADPPHPVLRVQPPSALGAAAQEPSALAPSQSPCPTGTAPAPRPSSLSSLRLRPSHGPQCPCFGFCLLSVSPRPGPLLCSLLLRQRQAQCPAHSRC